MVGLGKRVGGRCSDVRNQVREKVLQMEGKGQVAGGLVPT